MQENKMQNENKLENNNQTKSISEKPKYNITYAELAKVNFKDLLKVSSIPVFIASLCCLSPVILFSLGLVTLSAASELADVFYGTYKWVFRAVGLVSLVTAFVFYMRRVGVCTLDDVKKRRNQILNKLALTLIVGVLSYLFFLYVVVHYLGVFLNLWK